MHPRLLRLSRRAWLLLAVAGLVGAAGLATVVVRLLFTGEGDGFDIHARMRAVQPPPTVAAPPSPAGEVYRNSIYGYQIAVPPGWQVDERNPRGITLRPTRGVAFITIAVYAAVDLPPAPPTLPGYRDAWLAVMKEVMPQFTVISEETIRFGEDEALLYTYTWVDRGTKLRAQALLVRGTEFGYEVFGWLPEQRWPDFAPVFDTVLKSFTLS